MLLVSRAGTQRKKQMTFPAHINRHSDDTEENLIEFGMGVME